MTLENIEFKNPQELTQEMGDAIYADIFGSEEQAKQPAEEPKQQDDAQSAETEASQESELVEDIPNASIRLEKLKKQRDQERQQRAELEKQLAEMQGKLSVLENNSNAEPENDPTEYMDETQKLLFNKNKQLEDSLAKVTDMLQKMEQKDSQKRLQEQENQFFENNPDLKQNRDEFVDDMLDYLSTKPSVKQLLKDGQLSLGEVYAMKEAGKPKSVKTSKVSNPDKVFSGHSNSVPVGKSKESESELAMRKALQVLHDPDSTNKKQATDFLRKSIEQDIVSQLSI